MILNPNKLPLLSGEQVHILVCLSSTALKSETISPFKAGTSLVCHDGKSASNGLHQAKLTLDSSEMVASST